jgi:thiamine-monophosphate kinase
MLSEFDLIKQYFDQPLPDDANIALGIGDDCALLNPNTGMQIAISSDMLVSGRHFFADADPYFLGHKSLAVNLSDLAAMGAKPLAFTLALSLPEANPAWLAPFSRGLFELAHQHQCRLIGGDTTKGPLNICITIFGELPIGSALKRNAAKVDDDIWVSGQLGDARLALSAYLNETLLTSNQLNIASQRMHCPSPRIALGLAIRGIAHAALDVSDGLMGDLAHILKASQVGASLMVDQLPIGEILQQQALQTQREMSLAGGDDYELCFTAPVHARELIIAAGIASQTPVTRIGKIEAQSGLRLLDNNLQALNLKLHSFDHFTAP